MTWFIFVHLKRNMEECWNILPYNNNFINLSIHAVDFHFNHRMFIIPYSSKHSMKRFILVHCVVHFSPWLAHCFHLSEAVGTLSRKSRTEWRCQPRQPENKGAWGRGWHPAILSIHPFSELRTLGPAHYRFNHLGNFFPWRQSLWPLEGIQGPESSKLYLSWSTWP